MPRAVLSPHIQLCTYLHDKLARIGPRHGGALSCSQDPHCPDVEGRRPEVTSQHNTLDREGHRGLSVTCSDNTRTAARGPPCPCEHQVPCQALQVMRLSSAPDLAASGLTLPVALPPPVQPSSLPSFTFISSLHLKYRTGRTLQFPKRAP